MGESRWLTHSVAARLAATAFAAGLVIWVGMDAGEFVLLLYGPLSTTVDGPPRTTPLPIRRYHVIRVAVVDDHPALRAGLQTVLESEPNIGFVGGSDGAEEHVWPMLNHVRPDVLLLDYHLPRGDGLQLCYRIKQYVPAPRVLIFTAYASPTLALPATLARADGILAKGAEARDLFSAIRLAYAGEQVLPPISAKVLEEASQDLLGDDRVLVGLLLDEASEADVAQTLRVPPRDVRHAVQRILRALRLDVPAASAS